MVDYVKLLTGYSFLPVDPVQFYEKHFRLSEAERQAIENGPQRGEAWHRARNVGRASGTKAALPMGMAYGHPKLERGLAETYIWPQRMENAAMQHGTSNEPRAQALCEEYVRTKLFPTAKDIRFEYPGAFVIRDHEYFIASPDGLCFVTHADGTEEAILLEFKCPFNTLYEEIADYYYCQIQSYMGYLKLDDPARFATMRRCVFVAWTPSEIDISIFAFHQNFFQELRERNEQYFFREVLPRIILKECCLLPEGQVNLVRRLTAPSTTTPELSHPTFRSKRKFTNDKGGSGTAAGAAAGVAATAEARKKQKVLRRFEIVHKN